MSKFLNNRGDYVVRRPFEHYLDTNGDGTGINNAIGDYSAAVTDFYYAPAIGESVDITKLILHVADKAAFAFDGYGGLAAGTVTNGIQILFERLGVIVLQLTNGVPITKNVDFVHLNTDYSLISFASNYQASSVSFDTESFDTPLQMHGDLGDKLIVRLNDNFTGLDDHHFIAYGKV